MSHAPGPWRVDGVEVLDANNHHVVWALGNQNPADHALIAAAPDLLAALKVLREASYGNPWNVAATELADANADAAIAKAEGR